MNELQIFNNPEFGEVRTMEEDGKVLFVANDVAKSLGYAVPKDAVSAHCKGAVKRRLLTSGGEQEMKVIPEGDVYRLVTHSKLPVKESHFMDNNGTNKTTRTTKVTGKGQQYFINKFLAKKDAGTKEAQ